MPHAGNKTFKLCGPKDLLASLTAATKILAGVLQWMPPILPPSSDSRQYLSHGPLEHPTVAVAESSTMAAVSST